MNRHFNPLDHFVVGLDKAVRVIAGVATASRPTPAAHAADATMSEEEKRHAAGLMRVNHVGEVCAQALYDSQARFARSPEMKKKFEQAGREEEDHLAWTAQRLSELGYSTSILNPLWYAGSYVIGSVAANLGDKRSLGFVSETERQVEAHLTSHLDRLPPQDEKSRAIVRQMRDDEIIHGQAARDMGGVDAPLPIRLAMTAMSRVMTTTAYYI
ncbi:MAG TPA: 2-polyprenyl-3-methyl-6-methoxy-1,4-benzoquinone monooxygenase [Telluria sp.]